MTHPSKRKTREKEHDENDSEWDEEFSLLNKKEAFEDKPFEPSGFFTKAAKGTIKISTFMNNKLIPDDFEDVLDDMDEEKQNQLDVGERIENLKTDLKEKQKILTAAEYNKKCAIYEYLKRLGENGKGKMKASKEAIQLIFIDCAPYRARLIQYWVKMLTVTVILRHSVICNRLQPIYIKKQKL
ncbi:hypothetical protein RhiirB3_429742 [Rhizophagus irregularis]|nr:hypothetical protein RhiirB3_429742 [Rhizophagus irregularis]